MNKYIVKSKTGSELYNGNDYDYASKVMRDNADSVLHYTCKQIDAINEVAGIRHEMQTGEIVTIDQFDTDIMVGFIIDGGVYPATAYPSKHSMLMNLA